jgi:hypothetical protein
VSSSNRPNRIKRRQADQAPVPADTYDDDVLYDDGWVEDDVVSYSTTPPPAARPPRASGSTNQPSSTSTGRIPAVQGTAAQIDQLRRNLQQSSDARRPRIAMPERSTPRVPSRRQATTSVRRQPEQTVRHVDTAPDYEGYDESWDDTPAPVSVSRSSSRTAPQSTRTASTQVENPYEDDDYVYDEHDDFSEYDAPVRERRPRPQVSLPSLSRPSLPPAIASADIVNDATSLALIGASVVSLAGMAILVANRIDGLAPQFATHVSASGILEHFRGESALWRLPILATMCTLMNIVIAWFVASIDRFASRFVLAAALAVQFMAWVAVIRLV